MLKSFVQMQNTLARVLRRDGGATAVEYGLIVALIAGVIVGTVAFAGTQIVAGFNKVVNQL